MLICFSGQSKRPKLEPNEIFAEATFDVSILHKPNEKEARKTELKNLLKHIVALLNSSGGVIRIIENESNRDKIIKHRDLWIKNLEDQLIEGIMTQKQYKEFILIQNVTTQRPVYLFVKKCKRVCTQASGLKIPLNSSVRDATYENIVKILDPERVTSPQFEEEPEFIIGMKVPFCESDTVQFKLIENDLLSGIDQHLPNYVSAFANHHGGKVYFGIQDDGTVKGQLVDDPENVCQVVEKVMTRKGENKEMIRIWDTPDVLPKYDEHWSVDVVGVGENRSLVIVKVFPFKGGMFLKHPQAWFIDQNSENIVNMDFGCWKRTHSTSSGTVYTIF